MAVSIRERLIELTDVRPLQPQNRIRDVSKRADGSMSFRQESGQEFVVGPEDVDLQAYVIFMMLD